MGRALTTVGALIAIVAGVGGGIGWINAHVDDQAVWEAGLLLASILCVAWWISAVRSGKRRYFAYAVAIFAVEWVTGALFDDDLSDYLNGYLFAVAALLPAAIELFIRDRAAHRTCPDCREQIRVDANVCKHCGFRFAPRPDVDLGPVNVTAR